MTTGPPASMNLLAVLAREAERTGVYLRMLDANAWSRSTRCPPMSVLELAAHTRRAWARIADLLDAGPVDGEPEKDSAAYFRFDRAQVSPQVLARAQADAATHGTGEALLTAWEGLGEVIGRARAALDEADGVYLTILGTMRLSEYVRTRIVEVTVHHMDLRDAFGDPPDPDPEALEITGDVLRALAGTDLRPRGIDDVRFALIGTGRAPLDSDERVILGPRTNLFPLFA